jgi:transposase-like protein
MVTGAYKPRNPKTSALSRCVQTHFAEFEASYAARYQEQYGFYCPVIGRVVEKFLGCEDLAKGFERVRCDFCRHEYMLAFSCKGRYFCPSCHQKRVLQFGTWVADEVLAPVPHRQYVFTVPKMLRIYFRKDRRLHGKLSQCAADVLKTLFRVASKDSTCIRRDRVENMRRNTWPSIAKDHFCALPKRDLPGNFWADDTRAANIGGHLRGALPDARWGSLSPPSVLRAVASPKAVHFLANERYFHPLLLADNLVTWCKRLCLPAEYQTATLQTLRHTILLMPAQLQRVGNRPRLSLPASGPQEAAWAYALHHINRLSW